MLLEILSEMFIHIPILVPLNWIFHTSLEPPINIFLRQKLQTDYSRPVLSSRPLRKPVSGLGLSFYSTLCTREKSEEPGSLRVLSVQEMN